MEKDEIEEEKAVHIALAHSPSMSYQIMPCQIKSFDQYHATMTHPPIYLPYYYNPVNEAIHADIIIAASNLKNRRRYKSFESSVCNRYVYRFRRERE